MRDFALADEGMLSSTSLNASVSHSQGECVAHRQSSDYLIWASSPLLADLLLADLLLADLLLADLLLRDGVAEPVLVTQRPDTRLVAGSQGSIV